MWANSGLFLVDKACLYKVKYVDDLPEEHNRNWINKECFLLMNTIINNVKNKYILLSQNKIGSSWFDALDQQTHQCLRIIFIFPLCHPQHFALVCNLMVSRWMLQIQVSHLSPQSRLKEGEKCSTEEMIFPTVCFADNKISPGYPSAVLPLCLID